jgi:nitroreductase
MLFTHPVSEVIRQRFSCRDYLETAIEEKKRAVLADFLASDGAGPFGTRTRFELIAATENDRKALRGLGTYGFIKGATGFVVGAVEDGPQNLEDFGYAMERAILFATDLGLGTCWLGGSFTKSSFARKISAGASESVPAVSSIGYIADGLRNTVLRQRLGADGRLAWENLFFEGGFGAPISPEAAGALATPLEMVRLGPSASNKQPWRIVKAGEAWHFYMQRTPGYRDQLLARLLSIADLQRVDMGIAMSHFELAADELGLKGAWAVRDPGIAVPDRLTEYIVTWTGDSLPESVV